MRDFCEVRPDEMQGKETAFIFWKIMTQDNSYFAEILGVEKPTNMQIALYVFRLMDNYLLGSPNFKDQDFERGLMVKLAEKALKTMTNPHAKKLLLDKIDNFY